MYQIIIKNIYVYQIIIKNLYVYQIIIKKYIDQLKNSCRDTIAHVTRFQN